MHLGSYQVLYSDYRKYNLHVDLHTFPQLPEIVGDVAEDGLEGENEANPLVPRVTDLVALLGPAIRRNRVQFYRRR